jgi:hypothetical protein
MDEHHEHEPGKRIDLNSELGMSRRDLLRRSAIVGGALLWVAPAIQSVAPKAFAQEAGPGSVTCSACFCWTGDKSHPTRETGTFGFATDAECDDFCHNRIPGSQSEFCKGTDCDLQIGPAAGAQHGAFCS